MSAPDDDWRTTARELAPLLCSHYKKMVRACGCIVETLHPECVSLHPSGTADSWLEQFFELLSQPEVEEQQGPQDGASRDRAISFVCAALASRPTPLPDVQEADLQEAWRVLQGPSLSPRLGDHSVFVSQSARGSLVGWTPPQPPLHYEIKLRLNERVAGPFRVPACLLLAPLAGPAEEERPLHLLAPGCVAEHGARAVAAAASGGGEPKQPLLWVGRVVARVEHTAVGVGEGPLGSGSEWDAGVRGLSPGQAFVLYWLEF